MLEPLPPVILKTGETVSAAIVHGPDAEWADRIEPMLRHKGDPWTWQNAELLRRELGLAVRFHVLHRGGRPFANILIAESAGIALLGHVWTEPADRGAGASSLLMASVLERFHRGPTRAIYLGADPAGGAFAFYRRRGFVELESGSGWMVLLKEGPEEFAAGCFAGEPLQVEPLAWRHWPAAAPLCLGDFPPVIRLAAVRLIGRGLSEGPLLPVIRRRQEQRPDEPPCAVALVTPVGVVVALASLLPDAVWPGRSVLDVFCHPRAWDRAAELVAAVAAEAAADCVAYTDPASSEKAALLEAAGFRPAAVLPRWLRDGEDVTVWRKKT